MPSNHLAVIKVALYKKVFGREHPSVGAVSDGKVRKGNG
jgi:hypothetical protein